MQHHAQWSNLSMILDIPQFDGAVVARSCRQPVIATERDELDPQRMAAQAAGIFA